MKSYRILFWVIIAIAFLAFIKFFFINKKQTPSGAKAHGAQVNPVTVYVVKPELFQKKIFSTGTLLANEEVNLSTEASGKVAHIYFEEGSSVNKGALLLKMNDADLQAQLKKTEAMLRLAKDKEQRYKQLLEVNGISLEEYEVVSNEVNTLEADEQYFQAQLAKTEIRAPFSGTIGLKNVSEGSYVSPSVTVANIQQLDPLKLDFSVSEKYAGMLKRGDLVSFSVQGTDEIFEGRIYALDPGINVETRTIQIRALSKNSAHKLLPGAFAKVEILLAKDTAAILIPSEAIIPELGGKKVYVIKEGKAQPRSIETDSRTEGDVLVKTGLQIGDTVVITGIMSLKPGSPVKILEQAK